ncbi:putative proteasome regulatory particle subunit protein [Lasiodiplodia theobromae]|uniref:26S proteasome regulatory subunit rpn9 n=2 Tax=Lasiodiplodia TaxID=66739 RepID=A0AA39YEZ9_9PEZI|nr:Proteasome regulatory particle subunit [Lasiodiplodia theobromae]KAB2576294.1 putative 26S proteasome regulatory subunit rpn9 [Lasiodiplodia theobromae]KAF4533976.1 Proteasome regulatory particle subunit [Lasiodiplodia theobromae]KAF9638263.1 putative proteasome regulatory particle subunit protein [Lasiodiplodia theobromae]KAK0650291.1 putative 26S proteasome regulatory subunit rpn9 [Lasiodiplodia hormozganensis]
MAGPTAKDLEMIPDYLAEQRDAAPDDLQPFFLNFEDYWERKLWHELTDSLVEFYSHPQSAPQRINLFNTFVRTFADKINQLKLVTLGLSAASQFKDDKERLTFLQSLADKANKPASQDAYVYATVAVASVQLQLRDFPASRKKLDESERILDSFDTVETVVHASFYRVNAEYYKSQHEFASYYKNALLFLACVDISELPREETMQRAYDLSIAALVSDSIYNFGELLLHPILDSLTNTPHAWLRDLLFAFNRGDLAAYDVLSGNISKNNLLKEHQQFLYQKISLAALTETVFRRPPQDRAMTFQAISQETKVPIDQIEHLIMKALSLGLLKGTIDQVDQIAKINWVQPKVLDMKQIEGMRTRLRDWDSSVNQLGNWIETAGKDVWAA